MGAGLTSPLSKALTSVPHGMHRSTQPCSGVCPLFWVRCKDDMAVLHVGIILNGRV